jgi:DNA-binding YbaB/EbfC family protein
VICDRVIGRLTGPRSSDDPITRSPDSFIMNIQKMMAQAQAMQSKVQQELEALRIEASSGGGMVTVAMSGTKEILSVRIDPVCVDPKDVETLQDLVLAACREASRQVDEAVQKKTSAMLGGMMGGR